MLNPINIPQPVLPAELLAKKRWVTWQYEKNPSKPKPDKVPYSGKHKFCQQLEECASYPDAKMCVPQYHRDGVGWFFVEEDGIVGVDLDHALDDDGNLKEWAKEIINSLDSYTEYSPSKKGVHIFVKASVKIKKKKLVLADGEIEVYNQGRYFTVTEQPYEAVKPLQTRQGQVEALLDRINPPKPAATPQPVNIDDKDKDTQVALRCLGLLNKDRCDDYDQWIGVGMILKTTNPSLLPAWVEWSKQYKEFTPGECEQVWENFKRDDLKLGSLIQMAEEDGGSAIKEFIANLNKEKKEERQTSLEQMRLMQKQTGNKYHGKMLGELLRDPEILHAKPTLTSGYPNLDSALGGGFVQSGLYIFAGLTGKGKSTLLANILRQRIKANEISMIFNLEDTDPDFVRKLLAQESEVPIRKIKKYADLEPAEKAKVDKTALAFTSLPLVIQSEYVALSEIKNNILLNVEAGVRFFVVDQASWIIANGKTEYEQANEISKTLKQLAKDNDIVIVLLVQINRSGAQTAADEGFIQLHHLRNTGRFEQDSDGVILIQKLKWDEASKSGYMTVEIAKHRHGPREINLDFDYNAITGRITDTTNTAVQVKRSLTIDELVDCVAISECLLKEEWFQRMKVTYPLISRHTFNSVFPGAIGTGKIIKVGKKYARPDDALLKNMERGRTIRECTM